MPEAPKDTSINPVVENDDQLNLFSESSGQETSGQVPVPESLESPVRVFDTPITEPHEAGVLSTPTSPATLPENMPPLDTTSVRSAKITKKKIAIGAGVVGLLMAGGAYFGLGNKSSNEGTVRYPKAVATTSIAPNTTSESSSTTEVAATTVAPEYAKVTSEVPSDKNIETIYYDIQEYLRTGDQSFIDAAYGDNSINTPMGKSIEKLMNDRQNYFDNHYGTKDRFKRAVESIAPNPDGSFTIVFTDQMANVLYKFEDIVTFKAGTSAANVHESWYVSDLISEKEVGSPVVQY